jgi:hypothetical protein
MAQTGYSPILIYSSSTAAAAPIAGNLTNSTLGSELAINITDGKLFYKDNANAIQVIGWKTVPTTAGGTGLTSYTAGDLTYYASGTALTKLAIGSNTTVLTSSGTAPQWTAQSSLSVGTAANLLSNATTGVMQITGPGAGTTRVMTIPNANFTVARTDAAQNFTGNNTFDTTTLTIDATGKKVGIGTATPLTMFSTYNTSNAIGASQSTTGYAGWRANNTSGNLYMVIDNSTGAGFGQGNYARVIWSDGAYPLVLATNGTNRIQVHSGGGVSIGDTTDPGAGNLRLGTGNLVIGTSGKGIVGTTTNDNADAGNVGQHVSSNATINQNLAASTAWKDMTSISLTAGDWDVTVMGILNNNGATWTRLDLATSSSAGDTSVGLTDGSNNIFKTFGSSSTTPGYDSLTIAAFRVSLSATTTYYLKARATYSAGTPQLYAGRISARRVR